MLLPVRCAIWLPHSTAVTFMGAQRIAVQLAPLVEAMNGNGFQAVMAKASLKVRGILDSTTMRLPNVGPGEAEIKRAEDGMRASGLL